MDWSRAALLVVDMQNAYLSPGGTLDLAGLRSAVTDDAIANVRRVVVAARSANVLTIFLRLAHPPGWERRDGPDSPYEHKAIARRLMLERPELRGRLVTEGGWDSEIVPEVAPRPEDPVLSKRTYSGFVGTELDELLRRHGIMWLLLTGVASNVCVDSTLRDGFHRMYWPLLVEDATLAAGPAMLHDAMVKNTELFYGWVTTTAAVVDVLAGVGEPTPTR